MSGELRRHAVRAYVDVQLAYLHAAPARGAGVCVTCFGARSPRYQHCVPCRDTARSAGATALADLVVPITYRNGSVGQHSRALRMYKEFAKSRTARTNLAALFNDFCLNHIMCVKAAADVDTFTHVSFVPSTKDPHQRTHPLEETLSWTVRSLRRIPLTVNPHVPSSSRDFNGDWFRLDEVPSPGSPTDVLPIDDTWVTGARAQSAAYRLTQAGARKVVTIVLARQINPVFGEAKPLLDRITAAPYDPDSCAFHARAESDLPDFGPSE